MKNILKERLKRIKNVNKDEYLNEDFYLEAKRAHLKRSYYHFFCWSFRVLHPDDPFSDAPHIKLLCDTIQEEVFRIKRRERKTKDIIINIPPRTSKSLITSVSLLPWIWLHIPSLKMINISYDDQLVTTNSRLCKDLILSFDFQKLFGNVFQLRRDSNSVSYFSNNSGGFRLSKTTGSSIVGFGAAVIVVDDPQSAATARSEAKRNEINTYYSENLYNRLTPAQLGIRIIVQQRLHEQDLTGYLLNKSKSKYQYFNLPAYITEVNAVEVKPTSFLSLYQNGYLDPVRLDQETLDDFKDQLGTYGFASQYLQNPKSEDGGILKKHWFPIKKADDIIRDRNKEPVHFFLDTAYTEDKKNDPSALLAAFRRDNEVYIIRCESKRLEFPDLCRYIVEFASYYGYSEHSRIYVEPKASGKSVVQQIKTSTGLNIIEDAPPKDDKVSRVAAISPICESKRVNLIQGGWNDDFLDQICSISETYLPPHDDEADVLSMMVRKLLVEKQFDFMFI